MKLVVASAKITLTWRVEIGRLKRLRRPYVLIFIYLKLDGLIRNTVRLVWDPITMLVLQTTISLVYSVLNPLDQP